MSLDDVYQAYLDYVALCERIGMKPLHFIDFVGGGLWLEWKSL